MNNPDMQKVSLTVGYMIAAAWRDNGSGCHGGEFRVDNGDLVKDEQTLNEDEQTLNGNEFGKDSMILFCQETGSIASKIMSI